MSRLRITSLHSLAPGYTDDQFETYTHSYPIEVAGKMNMSNNTIRVNGKERSWPIAGLLLGALRIVLAGCSQKRSSGRRS